MPAPQEIGPYYGIINHHHPLIRPAIKAGYFLGGLALGGYPFHEATISGKSTSWDTPMFHQAKKVLLGENMSHKKKTYPIPLYVGKLRASVYVSIVDPSKPY